MSILLIDEAQLLTFFPINNSPEHGSKLQAQTLSANSKQQAPSRENTKNLIPNNPCPLLQQITLESNLLMPVLRRYNLIINGRGRIRIFTPTCGFLKLANTRNVPQFCIRAWYVMILMKLELLSLQVNNLSGEVTLHLPFFNINSLNEHLSRQTFPENFLKKYVLLCLPFIEYLIKETTLPGSTTLQNLSKTRAVQNVYRYMGMMQISNHFNESRLETEQDIEDKQRRRRYDIELVCKNKVNMGEFFKAASSLFQWRNQLSSLVPQLESDFELEHEQTRFIRWMLAMPKQYKPKNPFENLMVLNHIHVQEIEKIKMNRINAGGFSTIYLSQIKYLYVYSSEDHEQMHPQQVTPTEGSKKLLHKYMVIKKEIGGGKARSLREVQVLKKIKNGSSIFLPKYYIVTNRGNPHSDSVFMDFIPSRNLKEYLHIGSVSISLLTKLYLAFSVLQAMRYIRDYKIVHLDIKPNNIMIYCNMLIKLIDFGEAYHPDLPPHKPGYTVPYSPPEMFTQIAAFSTKSDVYSFGVLLFEMLYSQYPYDIFATTKMLAECMQDHMKLMMFAPQQCETYGDKTVMRVLNRIIYACMATRQEDRPQLDWIALVIKLCFQLLQ